MSTAEILRDHPDVQNKQPQLTLIEGGAELAPEPHIIHETLLPMVEIEPINAIDNLFRRLADLDMGSDTTSDTLADRGIYLWPINSGMGIHLKKSGDEEDTRVYIQWDENADFRSLRMRRLAGSGNDNPRIQFFLSSSMIRHESPQELLEVVAHLETEVAKAENVTYDLDACGF